MPKYRRYRCTGNRVSPVPSPERTQRRHRERERRLILRAKTLESDSSPDSEVEDIISSSSSDCEETILDLNENINRGVSILSSEHNGRVGHSNQSSELNRSPLLLSPQSNSSFEIQNGEASSSSLGDSDIRIMEDEHGSIVNSNDDDQAEDDMTAASEVSGQYNVNEEEDIQLLGELRSTLCGCTNTTEGDALLMVLALGLRHNLSYTAMEDILRMISTLFGNKHLPTTKYHLLKYSEPDRSDELYHFYCPECNRFLGSLSQAEKDETFHCDCGHILKNLRTSDSFIMTLGLKKQFQEVLQIPEVADSINHRFIRRKTDPNAYEDIYDGKVYRKLSEQGQPLASPNSLSVVFNCDGYPIGKSSFQEGWPIFLTINELPPKLRAKHMLLAGLWVGKGAPNMLVFLQPFVNEMNDLSTNGFSWTHNGEAKTSVVVPLCCCVDSQARWRVLNMKACTGYFGCTFCEHPGNRTEKGTGAKFKVMTPVPPKRTDSSIRDLMNEVVTSRSHMSVEKRPLRGVKGPCGLFNLNWFDLSDGMVVDYMHWLKVLVDAHFCLLRDKFLSKDDLVLVSQRLSSICPPSLITRTPRKASETKKFKASEWRTLIVFYGVCVLRGLVPSNYLAHWGLLSSAVFILLQNSITHSDLELASDMLVTCVMLYQEYFGEENMTLTVHLSLHVVNGVQNFGPLWTHSCFPFEGKNRLLLQLQKDPAHVTKEVARKFKLLHNLSSSCERFKASDEVLEYIESLLHSPLRFILRCDDCVLLGRGVRYNLTEEEEACITLQGLNVLDIREMLSFDRFLLKGVRFTTYKYSKGNKHDDSAAYLKDGTKVRLINVVRCVAREDPQVMIFCNELTEDSRPLLKCFDFSLTHIKKVVGIETSLICISPSDIKGQCIVMDTTNGFYISTLPYGCLGD